MISGCDHIGIQVRDLERSTQFYVENLGFERVARWTMSRPYVQKLVGYYPDVVLEIVSESSVEKDYERLPELYGRAGVSEFWRADVRRELTFEILRLIAILRSNN